MRRAFVIIAFLFIELTRCSAARQANDSSFKAKKDKEPFYTEEDAKNKCLALKKEEGKKQCRFYASTPFTIQNYESYCLVLDLGQFQYPVSMEGVTKEVKLAENNFETDQVQTLTAFKEGYSGGEFFEQSWQVYTKAGYYLTNGGLGVGVFMEFSPAKSIDWMVFVPRKMITYVPASSSVMETQISKETDENNWRITATIEGEKMKFISVDPDCMTQ